MKRPELNDISPEVVAYIEYLEGRGVSKLQLELAHVCDVLADDLEKLSTDEKDFRLLSGDDKTFANFLAVVKNKKDFLALSLSLPIEVEKAPEETDVETVKITGNAFENTSKKVKERLNGARRNTNN